MRHILLLAALLAGCGAPESEAPESAPPPATCSPDALPDEAGGCVRPGIPADECHPGFASDGADGCIAVLPATPCPAGTMATPGQTSCAPVAGCELSWSGEGPVQYVDGSYAGADSNGSAERPWTRIGDAVAAAPPGATVLVAAGLYQEAVSLAGKPLSIVGECPERVEIRGPATAPAVVFITAGADGSSLRGVALTAGRAGVWVDGASNVSLDALWIHDTLLSGIMAGDGAAASVLLKNSLIERPGATAALVSGVDLRVEQSVLRGGRQSIDGAGTGVLAFRSDELSAPGRVSIVGSVVEDNDDSGVVAICSEARIEASVVRDNRALGGDLTEFSGGALAAACTARLPTVLTVAGSVFERNVQAGIFSLGADLTVESTTIRDSLYDDAPGNTGYGIVAMRRDYPEQVASVARSLVERSITGGIAALGATLTLERVLVRDTSPSPLGGFGRGLDVQAWGEAVSVTVRGARFERSHGTGIYVNSADASLEHVWVNETFASGTYGMGTGIAGRYTEELLVPSQMRLVDVTVSQSRGFGVYLLNSQATMDRLHVVDTFPSASNVYGDGVASIFGSGATDAPRPSVTLMDSTIERSARAGIANLGGDVIYGDTMLSCNLIHLNGESDGFTAEHHSYSFEDRGGNACGCGAHEVPCEVVSSQLNVPQEP